MMRCNLFCFFFFSSRRRHTRLQGDWSSDVCSSDLGSDRLGTRRHAGLGKLYPLDPERLRAHVAYEEAMSHRPPLTQSAEVIRGLEELCSRRGRSESQEEQARAERPASLHARGGTEKGAGCPAPLANTKPRSAAYWR